ncbi:hypothetical protein D3C73_497110 [compost metagenome]
MNIIDSYFPIHIKADFQFILQICILRFPTDYISARIEGIQVNVLDFVILSESYGYGLPGAYLNDLRVFTSHPRISPKGQQTKGELGFIAFIRKQFRAETDSKFPHENTGAFGKIIMPPLMYCHQYKEHEHR